MSRRRAKPKVGEPRRSQPTEIRRQWRSLAAHVLRAFTPEFRRKGAQPNTDVIDTGEKTTAPKRRFKIRALVWNIAKENAVVISAVGAAAAAMIGSLQASISVWQNLITREMSHKQLRAYTGLKAEMYNDDIIKLTISNIGTTPAYNVLPYVDVGERNSAKNADLMERQRYVKLRRLPDIGNGQSASLSIGIRERFYMKFAEVPQKVLHQDATLYLVGEVKYSDVFNIQHTRTFCYTIEPKDSGAFSTDTSMPLPNVTAVGNQPALEGGRILQGYQIVDCDDYSGTED